MDREMISQEPVNVLFDNPSRLAKKNAWEIDIAEILEILARILKESGKRDLNVAGMAVLTSSLIYKMKVESIFALQRASTEKKPPLHRYDPGIETIEIPYRHESRYPVTFDELLTLLENLIGSLASPKKRDSRMPNPIEVADIEESFISTEEVIKKYRDLVMQKIGNAGSTILSSMVAGLGPLESIRYFFAVLFLAKDGSIEAVQEGDEIRITAIADGPARDAEADGSNRDDSPPGAGARSDSNTPE